MNNVKNNASNLASRLLQGSAILALSVFPTVAFAQAPSVETVEVTGTIIRGAGPTGSELISVGRAQIEDIGAVTIQNILSDVPGLNNFGGTGQGAVNSSDPAGAQSPTIHSLGNSASNGTLILVDGHRLPYTGNGHSTIDPSSIPVIALQQVQVLPDGASSTYGSDAVAGVLNFITRKNFTGIEAQAQYSFADHYSTFNLGGLFGHDWDGGSAMVAIDYSSKSELANGVRSYETARQDLRLGALANPTGTFPGLQATPPTGFVATTPAAGSGTTGPFGVTVPFPSAGSNFQNFTCPVATIKATSGATTSFLYPYNGAAIANNVTAFNGVCDNANFGTDLPSETRNTIFFSMKQNLTSNLSATLDFDYSFREGASHSNYGTISATAFGPLSGRGTPTAFSATTGLPTTTLQTGNQINPFYVGNSTTGNQSEFVQFDFSSLMQFAGIAPPLSKTFDETAYATFGLDYDIGGDWVASLGATGGTDFSGQRQSGLTCAACANLALNGSTNTNGLQNNGINPGATATSTTYNPTAITDPNGLGSYVAQTRQLTALNALDVWHPAGSNNTSAAVLKQIASNYSLATGQQALQDVSFKVDGPAFDLPAGPVKVAVGTEFTHNTMVAETANAQSGVGPSAVADTTQNLSYGRTVYAVYAEVLMPIVSPEMNIPLMQKLDVDVSGRWDHYTFYGSTENPKLGFTWGMIDGLQSRGSFGTSFTVPAFNSSGKNGDGITSQSNAGTTATVAVPTGVAANTIPFNSTSGYNSGAGIAGTWVATAASCAAAGSNPVDAAGNSLTAPFTGAVACKVNGTSSPGLTIGGGGGDPGSNIHPETGRSYSFGFDFDIGKLLGSTFDGLAGEVTYYQATYRGLITNINITTSNLGFTTLAPPSGFSPTSATIVKALGNEPLNSTLPPTLWWYVFAGQNNAYNLWTNGLDYNMHYGFDSSIGHWTAGISGNEVLRFTQQNIGSNILFTDLNGDAGSSGRFAAQQLTARATLNWTMDAWRAGLGFNFQSPYRQSNTNFPYNNPLGSSSAPSGFQKIKALQTIDFNAGYTIPDGWMTGLTGSQVNLSITNLFDTDPPFANSSTGFVGGSEIGRLVTVSLKKNF